MNRIFLLALTLALLAPLAEAWHPEAGHRHKTQRQAQIPPEAIAVLRHVQDTGKAPEGYVGGRRWENRERRLPGGGSYREYDIHPRVKGRNRGAERIVYDERSGNAWYTPDHYRSFIPFSADTKRR